MRKRAKIGDNAYKRRARHSISTVIRRHAHKPLDTAGELLDAYEQFPPVKADLDVLDRIEKGRGRRTSGRK